jgi:ABC-type uncharacterized transport system, permease component
MKSEKISSFRLYKHYVSINVRSMMQYKKSFLMTALGQFLASFNAFLGIYFLFLRFHSLAGYSYSEVLLCFSVVLMAFSLAECVARGFDRFPSMVKNGTFDRVLTRPRNEILQVLGNHFELTRIGRMIQALIVFVYGITHAGIEWSLMKTLTLSFMIIGGTTIFCGIFLLYAAFSFFTMEGLEVVNILTDGARQYGQYPVDVYGDRIRTFCTCVIPYALAQYYPLRYLTGRSDNWFLGFLPLMAGVFLIPCYLFWRIGVKRYKSSGS